MAEETKIPYQAGLMSSTAYASLGTMANANAQAAAALAARIRAEGSFYTRTLATADPVAFSNIAAKELDALRMQGRSDGFVNNANYLQALLRATGKSKATSALGDWQSDDLKAFREAVVEARVNGIEYFTLLEDRSKTGLTETKTKYNKSITTAINLIDKTDATTEFSKGYYLAYGQRPSAEQINTFMNRFNKRAQKEAAPTTTAGVTTTTGKGSTGKQTITTAGRGFTAEEQANFLARQLKKLGAPITQETGGAAKQLLDEIRLTYKNNNLSEPAFEDMAKIVRNIIGTGDTEMSKQMLNTEKQKIRNQAAKLNPGIADLLAAGEDVKTIADQYIKIASSITRKQYTMSDPLIKLMLNTKDEKGNFRPATDYEVYGIVRKSSDWDTSPDAINTFSSIGDSLVGKLGLG